jgi:hypothetical protein
MTVSAVDGESQPLRVSDLGWIRSSRCHGNGACVEVAALPDGQISVRDAKLPASADVLIFGRDQWRGFLAAVAAGDFPVG